MPPAPPAPWRPALLAALGLMWPPHLLAFVFGPLTECPHCVGVYLKYLAVMPGFLAGASSSSEALRWLIMILASGAVFLLVAQSWRAFPPRGRLIFAVLCLIGFSANGLVIAAALRA